MNHYLEEIQDSGIFFEKGSQISRYQLSGKLVYGLCGKPYYKRTRRRTGEKYIVCLLRESLSESNIVEKQKQLEEEKQQVQYQKDRLLEKLLDSVISDEMYKRKNKELEERE